MRIYSRNFQENQKEYKRYHYVKTEVQNKILIKLIVSSFDTALEQQVCYHSYT